MVPLGTALVDDYPLTIVEVLLRHGQITFVVASEGPLTRQVNFPAGTQVRIYGTDGSPIASYRLPGIQDPDPTSCPAGQWLTMTLPTAFAQFEDPAATARQTLPELSPKE